MKKIYLGFLLGLLLGPMMGWGQVTGDYRTGTTAVAWATAANWQTWDGTKWATASVAPSASNNVYVQAGHTATLSGSVSCKDLFISTGTTNNTTGGDGLVALGANVLSINGKLASYVGAVNVTVNSASALAVTVDANPPSTPISKTAASAGTIKFVGSANRTLIASGEWGANLTAATTLFSIEFALDANVTGVVAANTKASSMIVSSGILDVGSTTVGLDNGTNNQGDFTISAGATVLSSGSTNNIFQKSANGVAGTLTVVGTLVLTGAAPKFQMNAYDFSNGTIQYSLAGNQIFATRGTGTSPGNYPLTYGNVTLAGSGTKTTVASQITVINGTLSMQGTAAYATGASGTLTYGASSTLEYASSTANQTTAATEFPASNGPANLKINNTFGGTGVTLHAARTLGTSSTGVLTLTSGLLNTTSTNLLTLANTAVGAVSGGSTTSYVRGPLSRTLPASLAASANVYTFPVGKGGIYLPASLSSVTTGATAPVITFEATNATSGGSAGTGLSAISTTEYWQGSVVSGNYTSGSISLTRQAALSPFDGIGQSSTLAGAYVKINGTPSGTSINSSDVVSSLGYFVLGTNAAVATPLLTSAILSTALSSTYGTASTGVSTTAAGTNLTGNITATAQTNFEVSSTSASSGFGSSVSVASGTTIYVRLAATAPVSSSPYNSVTAVVLSGGGAASNANITTASSGNTVTAKALTITGLTANNKVFDNTTTATLSGTAVLNGKVGSDDVTLGGTVSVSFADAAIGVDKAVIVTAGYTLSGAAAGNYTLTQPTGLIADITAAADYLTLYPATQSFASLCNGTNKNISLTYRTGGTVTSPFIELSDASGSFATSTVSLSSTVVTGTPNTITGVIPAGQAAGSLYRIRISSSDATPIISSDNGSNITLVSSVTPAVSIGITSGTNPTCSGASVTFSATQTNGGSPGYQWKKNGTAIPGETGASYTSTGLANNDVISCVLTSSISCTTSPSVASNNITIMVNALPVNPGNPVTTGSNPSCGANSLSIMAADPNTNFYWQGTASSGTTTTNETTTAFPVTTSGTYYVRALSNAGCWSAGSGSIVITVNAAPTISVQPFSVFKNAGSNTSFSVSASNAAGYQWQVDMGTGFTNITDGGVYSGATTNTLNLTNVPIGYTGYLYKCIVKGNTCADLGSNSAKLTVTEIPWEDFETGTKTDYPIGNVTCKAGSWSFDNALLGTDGSNEFFNGAKSARVQNGGKIAMNFDLTSLGVITISHATYGPINTNNFTWQVQGSTNGGATWAAFTSPIYTATSITKTNSITVNIAGTIRFRIVNLETTTDNRINFDDIYVTSYTNCVVPTAQASFTSFTSVLSGSMTINFGSGTGGTGRIVVVKQGSAITGTPTSGTSYSPGSSDFSTALPTIATNEKVVYSGTGNSVNVTGLSPNTIYYVKIFEYSGTNCYLSTTASNTGTITTACNTPVTGASAISTSLTTGTTATLSWTNGTGSNRLVIVNAGAAITGAPVNGTSYSSNSSYIAAPTSANFTGKIVYNGTSNTVSLTNLTSNTVYYVAIFEFNSTSNCYVSTGATSTFTSSSLLSDIVTAGNESSCISSILNNTITTSTEGTQVWQFTIRDGGASQPDADALPTIINSIVITQGTSNGLADWTNIQSAVLFSGTTLVGTGTITSTNITFTGAPLTSVTDNTSKTLSLRITLKNPVSIPTTIDGKIIRFSITQANISLPTSGTSGKNTSASVATSDVAKDAVCVVATKLVYTTQPSNTGQYAGMSPSVVVAAYDANNNLDLDFVQSVSITSTAGAGLNGTPIATNAIAGVATFAGIKHSSLGAYTMAAASSGLSTINSTSYTISIVTTFAPGDFAIVAVNSSNNVASVDEIAFVAFKDIVPGTTFYMTDNGYERAYAGKWGTTEGIVQFTRKTGTPNIPAGKVLSTQGIGNSISIFNCGANDNANWTITSGPLLLPGTTASFDLNSSDQVWFMQGGSWSSAGGGGSSQDAVYSGGNVLYGWSGIDWKTNIGTTPTTWTVKGSRIYPSMNCFSTNLSQTTDLGKTKYIGLTTATTRLGWISRINDKANWKTYSSNALYYAVGEPDYIGSCITYGIDTGSEIDGKWTGGKNTDWFDCNNWDTRAVPTSATNVNISSTASNACVVDKVTYSTNAALYGNTADCFNLIVDGKTLSTGSNSDILNVNGNFMLNNSATLDMTNGGTFNLQTGSWSKTSSTFISGIGTVAYNSTTNQTIAAENYYNLSSSSIGARILSSTGTIGIAGAFTKGSNAYTFTGSTVDYNGSINQDIVPFTANSSTQGFTYNNLSLSTSGTKQLTALTDVEGALALNGSVTLKLNAYNLQLKSTINKTANVAPVSAIAAIDYTGGSGRFVVERYIPARRAWRLLTATANNSQTIRDAWMEGATPSVTSPLSNPDPVPGYGTHITGPSPASNYFDESPLNNYSIKKLSGNSWVSTGINTNTTLVNSVPGWMLFVRGDRTYPISVSTTGSSAQITTLRTKGVITTGAQTLASSATGLQVMGNPYPSAINFHSLSRSGSLGDSYYLWDPRLTGVNGVGAFVTFNWNGTSYSQTLVSSAGSTSLPTDGTIESGAAFVVDFGAGTGSLSIAESAKVTTSAATPFGRPLGDAANTQASLRTNLLALNADNSKVIMDGVLTTFSVDGNNDVTKDDSRKINNFSENLAIKKYDQLLAIERAAPAKAGDTLFLNLSSLKVKNYQFEIAIENLNRFNLSAYLEDGYQKTSTPVNTDGTTSYDFSIKNIPGSYAANRFRIVFKKVFTCNTIHAAMQGNDIAVDWQVTGEQNINHYEVERSVDGIRFSTIANAEAKGNNNEVNSYARLDEKPTPGIYYYRIKAISNFGAIGYSEMVQVRILNTKSDLYVYPNPVSGGNIGLQLNRQVAGVYAIRLINTSGQLILQKTISHAGGSSSASINYPPALVGNYQLEVTYPNQQKTIIPILIK